MEGKGKSTSEWLELGFLEDLKCLNFTLGLAKPEMGRGWGTKSSLIGGWGGMNQSDLHK